MFGGFFIQTSHVILLIKALDDVADSTKQAVIDIAKSLDQDDKLDSYRFGFGMGELYNELDDVEGLQRIRSIVKDLNKVPLVQAPPNKDELWEQGKEFLRQIGGPLP
jgi:hypothetical protein